MNEKSQPEKTKQDTLYFNTSSGIKSIVGKDLITDRYIAIFELVKNSYDARATEVIVSFNSSEASEASEASENDIGNLDNGKIYIVDNGKGMTKDDLENKWLFLAYSEKQEGQTENAGEEETDSLRSMKNRVYVGSKGIGRFSSDSLGSVIKIYTKVANEEIEHQLTVNWDKFDISLSNHFEDVGVDYEFTTKLSRNDSNSYTIIEISNLRQGWDKSQLSSAKEKLRRLKNPFIKNDDLTIYFGLDLFQFNKKKNNLKNHKVESNIAEILRKKSINISGEINPESIIISLYDRGKKIYEIKKTNDTILKNLNQILVDINFLTTSAKMTFARRMGISVIDYGNVFIYRNGFHVSPYGEQYYDIFGLNTRKTQGYNRYLATRELIGFISIQDNKNHFKETSSRNNGFIENGYFKSLEDVYMSYFQRPLERYVQLIKWGEDKETKRDLLLADIEISDNEKDNFKKYITRDGFEIIEFDTNLDFEKNKPEKIIERLSDTEKTVKDVKSLVDDSKKLKKQFRDLHKENEETKKVVEEVSKKAEQLERQNKYLANSRSEKSYNQHVTHHLTILAERLGDAVEDFNKLSRYIDIDKKKKFYEALDLVMSTKMEMEVFRSLLLESNIDFRASTLINWYEVAKWYFTDGRKTYYENYSVSCNLEGKIKKWDVVSNYTEILMVFENLYRNAFEHNATMIDFLFTDSKIIISSNSTKIKNSENIFELGFSTKPNGTGIGLHQVKESLNDVGFDISVENKDLVTFKISQKGS